MAATGSGTASPQVNNAMASSIYANAVGNAVGSLGNGLFGGIAGTGKWGNAIGMIGTNLTSNLASSVGQSVGQSVLLNGAAGLGKGALKAGLKGGLSNFASAGNLAGLGMSVAGSFMKEKSEYAGAKGHVTKGMDTAYDAISAGVNFIPGIGQGISLAMQANKLLGQGINNLGGGTDGMTTVDAILGSAFLLTTPLGMINGFGGSTTEKAEFTDLWSRDLMAKVADAYTDTYAENAASDKYGKKYGLFSRGAFKDAQNKIRIANMLKTNKLDISRNADLANIRSGMIDANTAKYQMAINGGYKPMAIGRRGLKLDKKDILEAKRIAKCIKKKKSPIFNVIPAEAREAMRDVTKVPNDALPFFKEGGNIELFQNGGDVNVIPEGALHAHKHHMEDDEHITKKGIPVVDINGKQLAEIERNEIIFRKEVTNKLEELAKDGSDEAAIEAGKLLAHEILKNTEDRTGLIEEIIGTPEQQTVENHLVIPEAKKGTKIVKAEPGATVAKNQNDLELLLKLGVSPEELKAKGFTQEDINAALSKINGQNIPSTATPPLVEPNTPLQQTLEQPQLDAKTEGIAKAIDVGVLGLTKGIEGMILGKAQKGLEEQLRKWKIDNDAFTAAAKASQNTRNWFRPVNPNSFGEYNEQTAGKGYLNFADLRKLQIDNNKKFSANLLELLVSQANTQKGVNFMESGDKFPDAHLGLLEELKNLSPEKLKELLAILKYLKQ